MLRYHARIDPSPMILQHYRDGSAHYRKNGFPNPMRYIMAECEAAPKRLSQEIRTV